MKTYTESGAKFTFSIDVEKFDDYGLYKRFKSYALKGVDFVFRSNGRVVLMEVKSRQEQEELNDTFAKFLHTLLLISPVWLKLPEADGRLRKLIGKSRDGKDIVLCITGGISPDRINGLQEQLKRIIKRTSIEQMFNCRVQVVDIEGLNRVYSPTIETKRV